MRATVQQAEELAVDVEHRDRAFVDGEEFAGARRQLVHRGDDMTNHLILCARSVRKTGVHPSGRGPRACFSGSCSIACSEAAMTIAEWCVFGAVMLFLLTIAPFKWIGFRAFDNSRPLDPAFFEDPPL